MLNLKWLQERYNRSSPHQSKLYYVGTFFRIPPIELGVSIAWTNALRKTCRGARVIYEVKKAILSKIASNSKTSSIVFRWLHFTSWSSSGLDNQRSLVCRRWHDTKRKRLGWHTAFWIFGIIGARCWILTSVAYTMHKLAGAAKRVQPTKRTGSISSIMCCI